MEFTVVGQKGALSLLGVTFLVAQPQATLQVKFTLLSCDIDRYRIGGEALS